MPYTCVENSVFFLSSDQGNLSIGRQLKILIFTEIYVCGGIDTFIVNLINNWPVRDDSFVIVSNSNYPGLKVIEEKLSRPTVIIRHKVHTYSNFFNSNVFLKVIREIASPVLRYFFIAYNILALRKLLLQSNADALMVINGGYPGGDTCRAATISWGIFSGKSKSIHNFHNNAKKAPWHTFLQERAVDWFLCRYTERFVTVSSATAKSMSLRPLIKVKNITSYIHNGLSIIPISYYDRPSIRNEIGILRSDPLCLMLGTYEPRKGHYFLLRAFRKVLEELPNAHLLICGYGFPNEVSRVRGFVKDMQLSGHVDLMGFRTDTSHLLEDADVLVVASQAYESFGYTSVEAMAHKVPVVATDVGGIPEVVLNSEGGYCVGCHDVESFSRAIVRLLKDRNLRVEQGERGFERYKTFFTAETMAAKYAELFSSSNKV